MPFGMQKRTHVTRGFNGLDLHPLGATGFGEFGLNTEY